MKQIILYLIFGGLTTGVNAIFYFLASWGLGRAAWLSAVIAWIFAASFAFVTNKFFVFQNKEKRAGKQATLFFLMRLASLALNAAIMLVFVDLLMLNEPLFFIIGQVVVLVFNYLASKFLVFKV
ncbi:MAG: GtrA family protein [Clostridiales bacterium]|jgi:putative flippase GtrA|nr:GtrA family protein [Clostridiales bacterium]